MIRGLLIALLLLASTGAAAENFPRPASLEPAVDFWVKVYTQITTNQGYIHDAEHLAVVYDTLDLPAQASRRTRENQVEQSKRQVVAALRALAAGKRSGLTPLEARVLASWPKGTSNQALARAAGNVRFQLGQSDRFREGMVRSGKWKPHIRQVLASQGLPQELDVLPHVESSFNPDAWSRVAAAGMWQFMPATGRQFMRVDHVVDQRMDPFAASVAAASLLKRNYAITGTWPLAVTSYNHGTNGVLRAARAVGSKDVAKIISDYDGPAFGFASRNFYPSFLAALEVDRNATRYFKGLRLDPPTDYEQVATDAFIPARALADATGLSLGELRAYNPALLDPVWDGDKYVPQGYPLRLPRNRLDKPLGDYLAAIPATARYDHQQPDIVHRIRPGDSLWTIAQRYDTTVSKLKALNGLRGNNIRAGRTLILPGNVLPEPPLATPAPTLTASTAAAGVYVIRKGDSLWSIARRFNISQQELVAWNDLAGQRYLHPGQRLKVAAVGDGQS